MNIAIIKIQRHPRWNMVLIKIQGDPRWNMVLSMLKIVWMSNKEIEICSLSSVTMSFREFDKYFKHKTKVD